jgi:hypothetical protein
MNTIIFVIFISLKINLYNIYRLMKRLNELEKAVIDKNLPDKEIELFWYGWKIAVSNSLKNTILVKSFPYQIELQKTSDILNDYQKNKRFNYIINTVQKSIITHIKICMENDIELYHTRILLSHIKRWNKIKLTNPNMYNIDENPDEFIFFDLYYTINKDDRINNQVKREMLDHIIFSDPEKLLDIAIKLNKSNIITKLTGVMNIYSYINDRFNTNFYPKTKASKMLKVINKIKK